MNAKIVYTTLGLAIIAASTFQLSNLAKGTHWLSGQDAQPRAEEHQNSNQPTTQASSSAQTLAKPVEAGFIPQHITISAISVDLPIVSVPLIDGTWAVNESVANFAEGTSLVNEMSGNVGIFAHDRPDGFTNIKNLVSGDTIIVSGNGAQATYIVTQSTVIDPTDVSVFYPTTDPQLTLITCDGLFSDKRYMVTATLLNYLPGGLL